ncbi:MAG: hypothetical protein ACT4QC_15245 [Planctomycetaceae bacterium]
MNQTRTKPRQERSLEQILQQFRRRALWIQGAAGGAWAVFTGLCALVVGIWLDLVLQLSPGLRIGVLLAAAGCAGIVFSRRTIRGIAQGAGAWLAARLDDAARTGGQIVSGAELAAASGMYSYSAQPSLTTGLAQLAIDRATRLAGDVRDEVALPAKPVGRSLAALAGTAGAVALLAAFMPRLAATELARFIDPFGDHPPFSTIQFIVEPGDTSVTYGAGLDIHVTVEGTPVDKLELVLLAGKSAEEPGAAHTEASRGEGSVLMFPDQPGEWRASISNVTRPLAYFVRARNARSVHYTIGVITVPRISEIQTRVVPPAYTRQPAYDGPILAAGISGLPGTEVTLTARSNRPLRGGSVTYISRENRREFPLVSSSIGSDSVSGAFPIAGNGRIEVRVVDVAGQASTETWSTPVTELVDEHPFVRVVEPRPVSFATPNAVLPVVASAEDDYGIARLQLFRNLNDSQYLPEMRPVPEPPSRHVFDVTRLPLELYGLEPGDEIKLFARVEDNDPRGGMDGAPPGTTGKGSESSIVVIRIISHEQFEQMQQNREGMETLLAKFREARRRIESLKEDVETLRKRLEEQPADEALSAELREALSQLEERFEKEAEALEKLSRKKHPFPVNPVLNREIEKMRDSVQRLQKRTGDLVDDRQLTREQLQQALEELANELKDDQETLEREAMEPLETLAALARMAGDESRFVELYRRQRDLAQRLESLQKIERADEPSAKARMRDAEEEERRIRLELDQLLNDIEDHAAQLPDDESLDEMRRTAEEFVAAVRESGADDAMIDAETGLAAFSGTRGHAGAKQAADILESFLAKCRNMGADGAPGACRRFRPGLAEAMQQTLQQLMSGMGPGNRSGIGSGMGGYSARNNNVGLYGDFPAGDSTAGLLQGESARKARLRGSGAGEDRRFLQGADEHDAEGDLRAGGANAAAVPLRYRRQVGRYFQRIADELGDK